MTAPLVEFEEVSLRRDGASLLERLSFSLARGERLTVLSEDSAGRDGLLRLLGGFAEEDDEVSGSLRFGQPDAAPIRRAYLPSPLSEPLAPHVSAAKQLTRVVARQRNISLSAAREELRLALRKFSAAIDLPLIDARPGALDKTTLAIALMAATCAQKPDLVLADRALADLGPNAVQTLLGLLGREQTRLGFGLIYVTGGLLPVARLGGRVLVLKAGRKVEEGDAANLLQRGPTHVYTKALFQSLPRLDRDPPPPRATMRGQPLLQVHHLVYGDREPLTFELRRGASMALVGEAGSGRGAMLRLLLGFDHPQSGRVLFDAVDLNVLSPAMAARIRRRIAFISGDDDTLDPRMTLGDTVEEPLRAFLGLSGELMAGYREAALKRVGLASHDISRTVTTLSTFDKRRLQVARAIVGAPLLVVVDEPLKGLDASAQTILREVLADVRATQDPAFLVVTSDFTIAQALAENAMVFQAGSIVERGPLGHLVREPQHAATKALLEAVTLPNLSPGNGSV